MNSLFSLFFLSYTNNSSFSVLNHSIENYRNHTSRDIFYDIFYIFFRRVWSNTIMSSNNFIAEKRKTSSQLKNLTRSSQLIRCILLTWQKAILIIINITHKVKKLQTRWTHASTKTIKTWVFIFSFAIRKNLITSQNVIFFIFRRKRSSKIEQNTRYQIHEIDENLMSFRKIRRVVSKLIDNVTNIKLISLYRVKMIASFRHHFHREIKEENRCSWTQHVIFLQFSRNVFNFHISMNMLARVSTSTNLSTNSKIIVKNNIFETI